MNTNSPYPQFAPDPNAPLDLSENSSYLSDCTNVYESQSGGGGGDYYTTGQGACYECNQTVSSLNPVNNGYQYMGTCSSAPTVGETGAGYVSDCVNYYMENPASFTDFPDPFTACASCTTVGEYIQNSGFSPSGTCSALAPLPLTTENFSVDSLNPMEQLKKKLIGIAVLIAVLIILYLVIRHFM